MKKKLLSILLSILMITTSFTTRVFADNDYVAKVGDNKYATLQEAITAAQNGDTVVLLNDIDNSAVEKQCEAGVFEKDITIDLNGHFVKGNYSYGAIYTYGDYVYGDTADLLITDNSINKNGYLENVSEEGHATIFQYDDSKLTIKDIAIKGKADGVYQHDTYNTLTVGQGASVEVDGLNGVLVNAGHNNVVVDGGSITSESFAINIQGSYFKTTVNDGTVSSSYGIFSNTKGSNASINVNGGSIKGSGEFGAIYLQGKSTVNVAGGNVTGGQYGIYSSKASSTINVSGGTVSGSLIGVFSKGASDKVNISSSGVVTCTGNGYGVYTTGTGAEVSVTGGSVIAPYSIDLEGTNSKITVDDGTITSSHTGIYLGSSGNQAIINGGTTSGAKYGIYVGKVDSGTGNSVTVSGGTVQATGNDAESAIGLWNGAQLTMTDGAVECTNEGFAIANNGSNTVATTINISGGRVSAPETDSTAIYQAGPGTTTISGTAEITGCDAGIEIRNGTLNVSGGSITSTSETFSCNANSNGTTTVGAALAIAQHTTKQDITVNLTGGTFKGIVPINECNPQENDPAPQVDMTVSDGEFWSTATENAKVFSCVDCDEFLKGGFYTHVPELEYIAPGYKVRDTTTTEKNTHGNQYLYTLGKIVPINAGGKEENNKTVQEVIEEINVINKEKEENKEEVPVSTITVTNGDNPIEAEIDDKIEIIAKPVLDGSGKDTNDVTAAPGYKLNEPEDAGSGNKSYTATALDIGYDKEDDPTGLPSGLGIKDSKQTVTELKQTAEGTTQAVKDSAKSVNDTNANKQLETIVSEGLNNILSNRGIHQGTAAKALNKEGIAITNEGSTGSIAAKNVNVFVLTYYDTEVLDDKTTQANKSYKLDITPMYQAYASTADDKGNMKTEDPGKNSVKIGDSLPVDCSGKTINLKIELPTGFITSTSQKVYVVHTLANGTKTYDTIVTENAGKFYIEFTNPDGFSVFEITLVNPNPTPTPDSTSKYKFPKTGVEGTTTNNHSLLKLSSLSLLAIGTYMVIKKKKDN